MIDEEKLYHDVRERVSASLTGIHKAAEAGLENDYALEAYYKYTEEYEGCKWMAEKLGHTIEIDCRLLASAGDMTGYCYDPVYLRIDGEELVDLEAGLDKTGYFLEKEL